MASNATIGMIGGAQNNMGTNMAHKSSLNEQDGHDRQNSYCDNDLRNRRRGLVWRAIPPTVTIAAALVVWQLTVSSGLVSATALASPTQIVSSMVATRHDLISAAAVTTAEALAGFAISILAGIALGVGLHVSRTAHNALYPILVAAQTIPIITIAPLFMIWFGFNPVGKVVLVAVFGVFSIVIDTSRGLAAVPRFYEDVALTCGATRPWALFHVKLRVAARQIFSGIRISAAYVFGTAVTAEYLGATNGLGVWLQSAFNSFQTPMIFSAAIVVMAETGLLLGLVALVERVMLGPASDEAFTALDQN
jgi:ABC-type nitrate/sulfonate/bicarbonate transport system permease component